MLWRILMNQMPNGQSLLPTPRYSALRMFLTIRNSAKMFHQENNPMRGKSMRSPIYFDPEDKLTAGGLVSGAEV